MQDFEGKVAIVTGAASGIGAAVAQELATRGAKVVVADFDGAHAKAFAESLGTQARSFQLDVADPEAVRAMVDFAVAEFGALHLAVNNAGIGGPSAPVADITLEDWHRVIDVDLNSVFYCLKYQIPAIIAAGGGSIVNMASILGAVGWGGSATYVTAKHALIGLTKNAAIDYADKGVRVNAVGPGFIHTPAIAANMTEEAIAGLASKHLLNRLGTPEEVAALTSFLLSDKASFMTGTYYPVDGGYLAR
ncbi:SDR family NAD(P)-dependent oxidoreductase [Sphingomonas sp. HITSZ_GF]|uniref:SDR family NAD(P)-dependent oxidoreductase n=1 Tax=Sphingomonas sp. HITSZ_GF TaxID=3037247 RepID=UPI00240D7DED|nr:SDR family NAD(P)-dependent oxidoreductase [Sphingomonas sp. HITSZ_GF]MDG2535601.1 SDR family NAD(P)-dependent oxidoreductase [Sphingomonas sp. HITSZ_GF]